MSAFSAADEYLESMVMTASPARLRWLLIEKACGLCDQLLESSSDKLDPLQTTHLHEVLTELLAGVTRESGELGKQVSDLYVFLLRHLIIAERAQDRRKIAEIRAVLEVERATWERVCQQGQIAPGIPAANLEPHFAAGLSLEA